MSRISLTVSNGNQIRQTEDNKDLKPKHILRASFCFIADQPGRHELVIDFLDNIRELKRVEGPVTPIKSLVLLDCRETGRIEEAEAVVFPATVAGKAEAERLYIEWVENVGGNPDDIEAALACNRFTVGEGFIARLNAR